jgi:DNA-binding NarL/FixJ family response regulator
MTILIVDDDKLVGISLKTIIETEPGLQVTDIGCSGEDAVRLYGACKPDILLMDIRMDGLTGLDAGEKILKAHADAKILYLTTFADDEYIVRALKIGAKGISSSRISKASSGSQGRPRRAERLRRRYNGENPESVGRSEKKSLDDYGITEKEAEVIRCIADGLSNREIAAALYLSEGTVRNSVSVIMDKLGLKRRTQIAIFYYKNAAD